MNHETVPGRSTGPSAHRDPIQISVVVCTYNRSYRLENALKHIGESAAMSSVSAEVIVVDNNSTDDTEAVVASIAASCAIPVRYAFEKMQGLSFARNRGLKEAKGQIILFTDDDCIADANWISAMWREFQVCSDVAVVGGRVDLYNEADHLITTRPFTERVRYTHAGQIYGLIIGCNLAVRREATQELGGFDPALGGSKGAVADDIEFVYRAFRRGLGVQFSPEARVFHDHGRRRPEEIKMLARNYVKGRGAFFCKYALKGDLTILRHAWWEVRAQLLSAGNAPGAGKLSSGVTLAMLASGALHFVLTRLRLIRP